MSSWNSLEIVKICVSLLTPIVVVIIGFIFNKRLKDFEKKQWTNGKILEKRLAIYDRIVPFLNDILCFNCYIGNWKEITPCDAIRYKRLLDKDLNIYKPLFDINVWDSYNVFIHLCFDTYSGWGRDATLRSTFFDEKSIAKNGIMNGMYFFLKSFFLELKLKTIMKNHKMKKR